MNAGAIAGVVVAAVAVVLLLAAVLCYRRAKHKKQTQHQQQQKSGGGGVGAAGVATETVAHGTGGLRVGLDSGSERNHGGRRNADMGKAPRALPMPPPKSESDPMSLDNLVRTRAL